MHVGHESVGAFVLSFLTILAFYERLGRPQLQFQLRLLLSSGLQSRISFLLAFGARSDVFGNMAFLHSPGLCQQDCMVLHALAINSPADLVCMIFQLVSQSKLVLRHFSTPGMACFGGVCC